MSIFIMVVGLIIHRTTIHSREAMVNTLCWLLLPLSTTASR